MDIYRMLEKLVDNLPSEQDKKAAREVIDGLQSINAFGSAARSIESVTDESRHVHVIMTEWDGMNAGMLIDKCKECKAKLSAPYPPQYIKGYRGY